MTEVPPLRREIVVAAGSDVAFRVFVERIGAWWPVAELSVFGTGSTVRFEGDDIVETGPDGRRATWGTVTSRRPGEEIAFTWHPGRDPGSASQVTVSFSPQGERTLVRLVHRGWEVFADPASARAEYDEGWPTVLDRYRDDATRVVA